LLKTIGKTSEFFAPQSGAKPAKDPPRTPSWAATHPVA
jgi:hypothetical protein